MSALNGGTGTAGGGLVSDVSASYNNKDASVLGNGAGSVESADFETDFLVTPNPTRLRSIFLPFSWPEIFDTTISRF